MLSTERSLLDRKADALGGTIPDACGHTCKAAEVILPSPLVVLMDDCTRSVPSPASLLMLKVFSCTAAYGSIMEAVQRAGVLGMSRFPEREFIWAGGKQAKPDRDGVSTSPDVGAAASSGEDVVDWSDSHCS